MMMMMMNVLYSYSRSELKKKREEGGFSIFARRARSVGGFLTPSPVLSWLWII